MDGFSTKLNALGIQGFSNFGDMLKLVAGKTSDFGAKIKGLGGKLSGLLGPKGLIVAGIVALIGYIVNLVRNCEDMQRQMMQVWAEVQEAISAALEVIQRVIGQVLSFVQGFIDEHGASILEIFKLTWEAIWLVIEAVVKVIKEVLTQVFSWIERFMEVHGDTIIAIFSAVWNMINFVFGEILENIKSALRIFIAVFSGDWQAAWDEVLAIGERFMRMIENILGGIVDIGKNLIRGLWEGILSMREWISDKVSGFFDGILGGVRRFLGINSPSKVFADEVGKMIVKGIAKGIDDEAYAAEESAIAMAKDMLEPQVEMKEHKNHMTLCVCVMRTYRSVWFLYTAKKRKGVMRMRV